MSKKKRKRTRPPKRVEPVTDQEYAALLARGGMALLDVLPRVVAHGMCTVEQAEMLRAAVLVETLNASVAAAAGI